MARIIVVIRGGVMQAVYTDQPDDVSVDLLDYDNMAACGPENKEELQMYEELQKEVKGLTAIW